VALILLGVLTLLGVTSMSTSSLEEKMSSNIQEGMRAFQLAETGLERAADDGAAYTLAGRTVAWQEVCLASGCDAANPRTRVGRTSYQSRFNGWSRPPTGSLWSADKFQAAHFDLQATGEPLAGGAGTGVTAVTHGGAWQMAPH
jgi:Tfp pilus assembly protein PilX